jgi:hypothetical protein
MNVVVTRGDSDAVSLVVWFWSFYLVFVVCVDTKILDVSSPPNHPLRNNVPTLFAHSEKLAEKMIEIMTKKDENAKT